MHEGVNNRILLYQKKKAGFSTDLILDTLRFGMSAKQRSQDDG